MTASLHILGRYTAFYLAAICGLATLAPALFYGAHTALQAAANVFFAIYLLIDFQKIHRASPETLRKMAANVDEPTWLIVLVALGAVVIAVASLFVLLNERGAPSTLDLTVSLLSVALGWLTLHTMITFHYAHLYWRPGEQSAGKSGRKKNHAGLDFPGEDEPGGWDFLYFSLVTGMTAQTSDVAITKTAMRKLNIAHAVLSFFFNTVLVAAAVNTAVSLAQ